MARVTNIIASIISGGKSVENVTIDTAWTGTDGDLVLSASVPATVKVGDTIIDSAGNTYLITGISGSNLTSQDFDTTTDPATGSATIQEAYQTITLWAADLDDTNLYVSGDDAIGEMYDVSTFDEAPTMNGGGTVGLNSVKLTVPSAERGDGTAGTGARIVATTGRIFALSPPNGFNGKYSLEWLEIDQNGNGESSITAQGSDGGDVAIIRNVLVHDQNGGNAANGFVRAGTRDVLVMNSIFYDNTRNTTNPVYGLRLDSDLPSGGCLNNIVFNVNNPSTTGDAFGINIESDDVDGRVRNNISMQTTVGGSGSNLNFNFAGGTNLTSSNNMSDDDTSDDGGGSNHQISKTVANQFVATVGDSEDLHIQDTDADSFETGVDLATTPANVNFDIDNFDRNAGATTWSIGAHDGDNLRTGDQTITPASVVATFLVAAATLVLGALTVTPASVAASFSVPTPVLVKNLTITPAPVTAAFGVPSPVIVLGTLTITPASVVATYAVPTPVLITGIIVTPAPAVATYSVPAPVIVLGVVTVSPAPAVATYSVPAPVLIKNLTISPAPVVATFAVPPPVLVVGVFTITPASVVATYAVPVPTLIGGGGSPQTITPLPVVFTFIVPIPVKIGDRFIVGVGATGAWVNQDNNIAVVVSLGPTVWNFITRKVGYTLYELSSDSHKYYNGTNWVRTDEFSRRYSYLT